MPILKYEIDTLSLKYKGLITEKLLPVYQKKSLNDLDKYMY